MLSILRTLPLVAAAALALPAGASAATYSVTPGRLGATAANARPGDVVILAAGIYRESATIPAGGVVLEGRPGAVVVGDPGAKEGAPALDFTGADGGPDVVSGLIVANLTSRAPAIRAGAAGVRVADAMVLAPYGQGLALTGGANLLQRALVYGTDAIGFASGLAAAKSLTIDSAMLVAGSSGAGIRAVSAGGLGSALTGAPGAMTIAARHVTIGGAANPFVLNADAPDPTASAGDIVATAADSIALGTSVTRAAARQTPIDPVAGTVTGAIGGIVNAVTGGQGAPNGSASGGTTTLTLARTVTSGDPAALFVDAAKLDYHLRADAPVLGRGGLTAGESTLDIDSQPRATGSTSDLGADEFVNRPPEAALRLSGSSVREGASVTLDGSRSRDPEAAIGGGIVEYRWNFGDGQTATTATPTVTHDYAKRGSYTPALVVVDRQGGVARPATAGLRVTDGAPPKLVVGGPAAGSHVKGRRLLLWGTASDDSGVAAVHVAIRLTRKTAKGRCYWLDPRRGFRARSCSRPILISPKVANGRWRYRMPSKLRLRPRVHELLAAAVDGSGLSSPVSTVRFRVIR